MERALSRTDYNLLGTRHAADDCSGATAALAVIQFAHYRQQFTIPIGAVALQQGADLKVLGHHIRCVALIARRIDLLVLFERRGRGLGQNRSELRHDCRSAVCSCPADIGLARQIGNRQTSIGPGCIAADKPGQCGT